MDKIVNVQDLDMDCDRFLDKSTVLLGPSRSGKSTIIVDILYQLRDKIDQIIVISPMDKQNHTYDRGIVPLPFIHYDMTIESINLIWERQQALVSVYGKANNPAVLNSLFNRCNNTDCKNRISDVQTSLRNYCTNIDMSDRAVAQCKIEEQQEKCGKLITAIHKLAIENSIDALHKMSNLSKEERFSLKYININPRLMIIFDDCTEILKQYAKHETMSKLFTMGRWNYVSFIIGVHGDTALPPTAKKNVFNTIFTDEPTAHAYFERKTNDYDKESKKRANDHCKLVFTPLDPFQKLVYVREEGKYYKYRAKQHGIFRFGSPVMWEYCDQIKSNGAEVSTSNKFMSDFT